MTETHCVTIDPGMHSGEPCIDSRRITAAQMARVWWFGRMTVEEIEENWPGINRGALLVCCWYMARYGGHTWRKRWKDWLAVADGELWKGNYATCELPPQRPPQKEEAVLHE